MPSAAKQRRSAWRTYSECDLFLSSAAAAIAARAPRGALIEIAHHDFRRESLLDEAKRQSLVPAAAFDPVGILNPGRMYPGI